MRSVLLASAATLALAAPAQARDTVIDDFLNKSIERGDNIEIGERVETGSTVEWKDVVIRDSKDRVTMTIDWLLWEDIDDGARVTLAPQVRISVTPDDDERSGEFELRHEDLAYTFRERGDNVEQEFAAASVELVQVSGNIFTEFSAAFMQVAGGHIYASDDLRRGTGNMTADKVDITYGFDAEDEGSATVSTGIDALTLAYSFDATALEPGTERPDLSKLAGDFTFTAAGATSSSDMSGIGAPVKLSSTSGPTSVEGRIGDGRVSYGGDVDEIEYFVDLAAMGMPPATVTMASASFGIETPIAKSDTPSDLRFQMAMRDVAIDEALWGMFDPGAVLPRDPINLVIDLAGQAQVLADFSDVEAGTVPDMPYQVSSLALNELSVNFGGADVTGSGAVDISYNGPIPQPVGSLRFALNGINGLLDNLGTIGILNPEQAMPARMMLGMFATPVGDDQLESVIEFKADGAIMANGQRIR